MIEVKLVMDQHFRDMRSLRGILIVNADDWGRDRSTTDRTLDCILRKTVSSVSAMVFMEDSERAAVVAREHKIDAGIHLNFTTLFTAASTPMGLIEHQQRLTRYLRGHRFSQVVFHPGLRRSFDYVVKAQLDEFRRIYGLEPARIDGHHHMHLCSNVVLQKLMPSGAIVRRNFSFQPGEKGLLNRLYRKSVDSILKQRYKLVDFMFALPPLEPPDRLRRIFALAEQFSVEIEAHPVISLEYQFLMEGDISSRTAGIPIASSFLVTPTPHHSPRHVMQL